jgi:hypothetical protein
MILVKEGRPKRPSSMTCRAPARLPSPAVYQLWRVGEGEARDEQELLERIEEICQEYAQHLAGQITIRSYQALPPEAVSMLDPPERAWLVHLDMGGYDQGAGIGQEEIIAALRDNEIGLILR